jgi:hypothetical protein
VRRRNLCAARPLSWAISGTGGHRPWRLTTFSAVPRTGLLVNRDESGRHVSGQHGTDPLGVVTQITDRSPHRRPPPADLDLG